MKHLFLLFFGFCSSINAQNAPSFALQPQGRAFINLTYIDNPKNQLLLCYTNNNFPPQNNDYFSDSLMKGTGTKNIVLELKHPSKIPFQIGGYQSTFYLSK